MMSRRLADYATSQGPVLKLPHPYLTSYYVHRGEDPDVYQLITEDGTESSQSAKLDSIPLRFTEPQDLKSGDRPDESNNTPWARARRSPSVNINWTQDQSPSFPALWLVLYVIFTIRPEEECFRLKMHGPGADKFSDQLKAVALAITHPHAAKETCEILDELLVIRGAFWQGAGSPFGPRPVWVLEDSQQVPEDRVSAYPLTPLDYTTTINPPAAIFWHPRRPVKPRMGSVIYSRYIPHLKETFSMVALDYRNKEHLDLFHQWQNDPRVSQGWNETGTLDQHQDYLRRAHEDPHQITILARFEDTFFAYFEVYWAKVRAISCALMRLMWLFYSLANCHQ